MQLALVENPRGDSSDVAAGGDFALRDGRLLLPVDCAQTWTYAGIGCFRRRAFDAFDATAAARFPLLPVIERAIAGGRAGGQIHRGQWLDVGTPERLAEAQRRAGQSRR